MKTFLEYQLISYNGYTLTVAMLLGIFLVWLITTLSLRAVRKVINRGSARLLNLADRGRQLSVYLLIKYFVWTLAVAIMLEMVGIHVSAILAGSAALLVGLGLGGCGCAGCGGSSTTTAAGAAGGGAGGAAAARAARVVAVVVLSLTVFCGATSLHSSMLRRCIVGASTVLLRCIVDPETMLRRCIVCSLTVLPGCIVGASTGSNCATSLHS